MDKEYLIHDRPLKALFVFTGRISKRRFAALQNVGGVSRGR
jgi:hypothetical protein